MRILVVEDDPDISGSIRDGLERAGYSIEIIRDGERALGVALKGTATLIILDLMLPGLDGLTLCERLRGNQITTPILMLTAKGALGDRVAGLERGADDYLTKPFEFDELLARVRALLRRDKVNKASRIEIYDLVVDTATRVVTRGGQDISLTPREYKLLEALASKQGQILTRDTIQLTIWDDVFSTSNTVDVHIRHLRRKVDEGHEPKIIHTVVGVGYVLRAEEPATTHPCSELG